MKNVEDIYPVSPMQEFMLLHSLSSGAGDTLFNQFVFGIERSLEPDAFEKAWNQVIASHTALRTAFIWKGVESPQQVVRKTATAGCQTVDLTQLSGAAQESEIQRLLDEDRQTGFDFRRAPLIRFLLIQLSAESWRMVWSSHHLILDRWCIDGLFNQFQRYYAGQISQAPLPMQKGPSYRDYVGWIHQQDTAAARTYWAEYLRGFSDPVAGRELFQCTSRLDEQVVSSATRSLGADLTSRARDFSATLGVTLSCVVQAALALAINRLLQKNDVVFGMTVSGRPAALAHVEDIVGSFITSIPVRVPLRATESIGPWLRALNSVQFKGAGFDYLSPAQLRACTSLTSEQSLFDLLMVWLSQTQLEQHGTTADELPLEPMSEQYATAYPLTLSIIEKPEELVLRADAAPGTQQPLQPVLDTIAEALEALIVLAPDASLSDVDGFIVDETSIDNIVASPLPIVNDVAAPAEGVSAGREGVRLDVMTDLLRTEWQRLLDSDEVFSDSEDFFDVGGDSLKAATLHARIEAATRKTLPLLALFEDSSLSGMARTLVDEKWPLRAGIAVPLQSAGSGSVLFCVASPEVNTLGYAMLTRHLPKDQNVVLLQEPPNSNRLEQLHPDELPDFASRYVEALRRIQPEGPYSLLSMCSGSHIAHAMVRQLENAGEVIQFAGVINTWSLYSISWKFYVNRFINVAAYYKERIRQYASDKMAPAMRSPSSVTAGSSAAAHPAPPELTVQVLPAESAVGLDNPWIKQVGFAHRIPAGRPVNATVTVFRLAQQPFWRINDSTLGWSRLANRAETVDVDGDDHDSILREPFVQHFAECLVSVLSEVSDRDSNLR